MQRYGFELVTTGTQPEPYSPAPTEWELNPSPKGEWVLHSEAQARIEALESALTTLADTYAHFQNCYREVGFGDPLTERALMLCLKAEVRARAALENSNEPR